MGTTVFYVTIHTKQCQRSNKKFAFAYAWCEQALRLLASLKTPIIAPKETVFFTGKFGDNFRKCYIHTEYNNIHTINTCSQRYNVFNVRNVPFLSCLANLQSQSKEVTCAHAHMRVRTAVMIT